MMCRQLDVLKGLEKTFNKKVSLKRKRQLENIPPAQVEIFVKRVKVFMEEFQKRANLNKEMLANQEESDQESANSEVEGMINDDELDPVDFFQKMLDIRDVAYDTWRAKGTLANLGDDVKSERTPLTETCDVPIPTTKTILPFTKEWKNRLETTDSSCLVSAILEKKIKNITNAGGDTMLHKAGRKGKIDVVKALLLNGANVRICDESGRTPLHDAFWTVNFNSELVKLIIHQAPELIFAEDRFGAIPLSYVSRKQWRIVKQFIAKVQPLYWTE